MTHKLLKTLVVAACASLVGAAPVWAGAGALDTSYGQGGLAIADFGTFSNGAVVDNAQGNAMVVQPDGRVIVVGTGIDQFGQTSDIVTARFTAAGALDPSWGSNANGKAQFDFGQSETGYAAVLQPDGRLIVGGDTVGTTGTSDVLAVRIATNGTLDGTFGSQGRAHPDFGDQEFGRAIALRSDGRIVIAGYGPHGSLVVRLTNSGAPDTTFDRTGGQVASVFQGPPSADAVAFAPDGSTDFAGTLHDTIVGRYDLMIGNAKDDGSVSVSVPALGGTYEDATAIAELPDGSQLLAGYTNVGGTDDFALARYRPGAGYDSTFGTAGKVLVDLGGTDDAHAMVVQPDGKIVVAGTSTVGSGSTGARRIGVVRFLANGQLDPTFGTNGMEVVAIAGAKLDGNAVGLQANGDIIVGGTITPAGSTRKQLLAIRLHGDSTGSTSTGGGTSTTGGGSTGGSTGGAGGSGGSSSGGSGATPTCQGHKATIVGTAGADTIEGTSHADVIVALGGNDVIDGKGGNDIICAGAGNDHVSGGAGNDRIYGQDGADTISGGAGADSLDGGSGNDHLNGGAGADVLTGDGGNDSLAGGAGSDHLSGGPGNDSLTGGAGKDALSGGTGRNHDSQ